MNKTRRERRADAVERLRELLSRHESFFARDMLAAALYNGDDKKYNNTTEKQDANALIDLLSEDECEDVGGRYEFKCSACGARIDTSDEDGEPTMWYKNGVPALPNFCPSCGARVTQQSDLVNCGKPYGHGSAVLDGSVISDTGLHDAEQKNRRSRDGGEDTSVSLEGSKVTFAESDSREKLEEEAGQDEEPSLATKLSAASVQAMASRSDTREKLEEDVRSHFALWVGGAPRTREAVLGWLDRQAAITESECIDGWMRYKHKVEKEIAKYEEERDELKAEVEEWKKHLESVFVCWNKDYEERDELRRECDTTGELVQDLQRENDNLRLKCKNVQHLADINEKECKEMTVLYHQTASERDELGRRCDEQQKLLDYRTRRIEKLTAQIDHQRETTADMVEDMWCKYKELEESSMRLPVDADGVPICVGDVMVYADGGTCPMPATAIVSTAVFLTDNVPRYADMCRHYHAPTVADVLTDFARDFDDIGGREDEGELWASLLSKYADKLQLKGASA